MGAITVEGRSIAQRYSGTITIDFDVNLPDLQALTVERPVPLFPLEKVQGARWTIIAQASYSSLYFAVTGHVDAGVRFEASLQLLSRDSRVHDQHIAKSEKNPRNPRVWPTYGETRASLSASLNSVRYDYHDNSFGLRVVAAIKVQQDSAPHDTQALDHAALARRTAGQSLTLVPHDFRLWFPRFSDAGAEMWANAAMLSSISPFLKTMLASEYAEGSSRRTKRPRGEVIVIEADSTDEEGGDDSDDEADAHLRSTQPPSPSSKDAGDLSYRQMTVKEARYSTWRAVLVYLSTGHIDFAPLLSSGIRSDQIYHDYGRDEPDLPLPVSPKSVYRLAHLLELPDLEHLAFSSFVSSLTVSGAAYELFGPACLAYEKLRVATLEFIVKNWNQVKASESWKDLKGKAARGEIEGGSQVIADVLDAVA